MRHVAVVKGAYLDLILSGLKRAELRLAKNRCAPYGVVHAGDTLYFKRSGGGYGARATVERVETYDLESAPDIERLRDRIDDHVRGSDAYWASKAKAQHATVVWFGDVRRTSRGPALPPLYGRGWVVLGSARTRTPEAART